MQTTMYLVRHGEVYNPNNIIYGRLPNFSLSKKGEKELKKTAEFLKDKAIDIIYSSPLQRAQQSAKIIQKNLTLPTIHIADEITEIQTSYQGRQFSELDELQSEVYLKPLNPSDETIEQIAKRMKKFIEKLAIEQQGKHIILISHGDPIMILRAVIENKLPSFYVLQKGPYIHHGEVYKITDDDNHLSLTSVFKPEI